MGGKDKNTEYILKRGIYFLELEDNIIGLERPVGTPGLINKLISELIKCWINDGGGNNV